jgi:circadian clock protein KaiC
MADRLQRVSTGVSGLDEVLDGGLVAGRSYLVRGAPGSGKTVLGFHFLTAGAENGERALFVNLEEDEADARANAASLGFVDSRARRDRSATGGTRDEPGDDRVG